MAAVKDLFVNLQGSLFVNGAADPSQFLWPKLYHNDNLNLAIRFLKANPTGSRTTPFTLVPIASASLTAKLWKADNTTILAQQTTWAADTANNILSGELNLFTANMTTAFASSSTMQISTTLELTLTLSDGQYTVQVPLTIYRSLNATGAAAPEPEDQYLTLDQAKGLFAQFVNGAGRTITLTSADGTKKIVLSVDNDGSFTPSPQQ